MISRAQIACSVVIYLAAAACGSAQTQSALPPSADIIAQMVQAQADNHAHFRPYVVTRDYKLFEGKDHSQAKSRITAEIIVVPPESKQYIIVDTDGSSWGEKIVRTMLDGEVSFAKDSSVSDITRDNYNFLLVGQDELSGQRCYVLELLPKRKSKDLLRGTIWVDASTYLPQRIEGEPAKSPSWWLKDVRVVLLYGYVGQMWLQTSSKATANVRILGQSTMVWHDVKYQVGNLIPGAPLAQTMVSVEEIADVEGQR